MCHSYVYNNLLFSAFFVLLYAVVTAISMVRASRILHYNMLYNILRSPMHFFDTTPIGRILNRFSRDIETIDNLLPNLIRSWLNTFFGVLSTIIVISYSTPIFLSVVIPLTLLYYFVQVFFRYLISFHIYVCCYFDLFNIYLIFHICFYQYH